MTCHALAMRLVGASYAGRVRQPDTDDFDEVLHQAIALLHGDGLPPDEADELRSRLLAGFRWVLIDEYQDLSPAQYDLISALAGRTLSDADSKLTLLAVGDDDQNIYAFAGASVEFIRRFEADYDTRSSFLTGNYRSTKHIIEAANAVVAPVRERMKAGHPLGVDRARRNAVAGGIWERRDPVARGRVQVMPAGNTPLSQARAAIAELHASTAARTFPRRSSPWSARGTSMSNCQWWNLIPTREHARGPSRWVADAHPLARLQQLDNEAHDRAGRVELAALLTGIVGELADEVLVGRAQNVDGALLALGGEVGIAQVEGVEVTQQAGDDAVAAAGTTQPWTRRSSSCCA